MQNSTPTSEQRANVQQYIIAPMMAAYQAPRHLTDNARPGLELYVVTLAPYSAPTLQTAWQRVVEEHSGWTWPAVGKFATLCRELSRTAESGRHAGGHQPCEQREKRITEHVERYEADFRHSPLAARAREEGWLEYALAFVRDWARTSAQVIECAPHLGWQSIHWAGLEKGAEKAKAYLHSTIDDTRRRQVIDIQIPTELIERWHHAAHRKPVTPAALHTHAAGDIVSGTLADARVAQSNVTQHEGAITHANLSGAGSNTHAQIDTHLADAGKHREINDAGSAATDLWSASKIATELSGKSATGHGHAIGDVTGLQTALDGKAASAAYPHPGRCHGQRRAGRPGHGRYVRNRQ